MRRRCRADALLMCCQVIGGSVPALIGSGLAAAVRAGRTFRCQRYPPGLADVVSGQSEGIVWRSRLRMATWG